MASRPQPAPEQMHASPLGLQTSAGKVQEFDHFVNVYIWGGTCFKTNMVSITGSEPQ